MKYFKPTYKNIDDDVVSHNQYQEELLKAFCLKEFDLEQINKKISDLYKEIGNDSTIHNHLEKYKNIYNVDTLEISLCLMFSWTHFYEFYPMIEEFLETRKVVSV